MTPRGQRGTPIRTLILIALLAAPALAWSGVTHARIHSILFFEDGGLVYVYPEGGVIGAPACHGSNGSYYSFAISRPMARDYIAALLTAYATGATVQFYGRDACVDQSVSETLAYLILEP